MTSNNERRKLKAIKPTNTDATIVCRLRRGPPVKPNRNINMNGVIPL
jgi:hypothetical protein